MPSLIDLAVLARHLGSLKQLPGHALHPAPEQYADGFGDMGFGEAIRVSNDHLIPRSLSLHFSASAPEQLARITAEDYLRGLLAGLGRVAELFDPDREVVHIALGEGLPEFLGAPGVARLLDAVPRRLRVVARPEVAVTLRPGSVAGVAELAAIGCTRATLLDTGDTPAEWLWPLQEALSGAGFAVTVQLPVSVRAAADACLERLDATLAWRPDRVALDWHAAAADAAPGTLAPLLVQAAQHLQRAGYQPGGTDLYLRAHDPLLRRPPFAQARYCDLGGVEHAERTDLIGIGPGAQSQVGEVLCRSAREFGRWRAALGAGRFGIEQGLILSQDECIRAEIMQALACEGRLDIQEVEMNHSLAFRDYFAPALTRLQPLLDDGLACWQGRTLLLSYMGRLLWRIFVGCFQHPASAA